MKRRRRILWKRLLAWIASVASISAFLYAYAGTDFFTIRSYVIEGAPEEYLSELEQGMAMLSEQKLFYTLPANRSISYRHDDIRTLIEETLTNTKTVRIYPANLHTLRVVISPHAPLFSVSETHAITADGVIYKEIIPLTEYPRLSLASTTIVTRDTFLSLSKLVNNISSVVFVVKFIDIDGYNDIRLYNEDKTSSVVVSSSADMGRVWSNVLSAIDTEPLKGKLTSDVERLEYLDTRFGNKVFYKFTNSQAPDIIPDTHATTTATTSLQ